MPRPVQVVLILFVVFAYGCAKQIARQPVNPIDECSLRVVTHNTKVPGAWSSDGTLVLVNKQDSNGVFQIYVGTNRSSDLIPLSNAKPGSVTRPWDQRNKLQVQWSKSNRYIICAVEKDDYNGLTSTPYAERLASLENGLWMDLWAVTPDGKRWYPLRSTDQGLNGPALTPDGAQACWAEAVSTATTDKDVFGKWTLNIADLAETNTGPVLSNIKNITPAGAAWIEPGNFAPDGHSLLISSDIGIARAEGQDQFILDINTGAVKNLTNTSDVWDEHGMFSPDGKKILFMSSLPYRADASSSHAATKKTEFMIMNADGSQVVQLTHYGATGFSESSPGTAATGTWAADGRTITAQTIVSSSYDQWLITFSGYCGN